MFILRTMIASAALAAVGASLAMGAVQQGTQADPAGDAVVLPGYGGEAFTALDISSASVQYDPAGVLSISFSGDGLVRTHSGTAYEARISTSADPVTDACGATPGTADVTLAGQSFTGSSGGPGKGTATLSGAILDNGSTDGVVTFSGDDHTVTFTFTAAALAGRPYLCAGGLRATFTDATNVRNIDDVAPFCIAGGCFDAAPPAVAGAGTPAPAPAPAATPIAAPLVVHLAAVRGGLPALRSAGLRLPVRCSAACAVSGRLLYHGRVVGRGATARLTAGGAVLVVRASSAGRSALHGLHAARASLRLTISDGAGHTRHLGTAVRLRG